MSPSSSRPRPEPTPGLPEPFETCRHGDAGARLREADAFFGRRGEVHRTLDRLAIRLEEAGIEYAVIGGLAVNVHGHIRVTTDIDIVVTRDGRTRVHELLAGCGFLPPFTGSRNLRDTSNGVKIDLLLAGEPAGTDDPKPIVFPDPSAEPVFVHEGVRYVTVERLVELKLASGMSNPARLKDLADVVSLIGSVRMPRDFGERLHPWVRAKWYELWDAWDRDPRKDQT
jgi:hypothetical protein